MMTASHSSPNLCEKLDTSCPKCLGDQVPSHDTSASIPNINFDCSICLELPHDPVVTMCGHLFCWSCLHHWITIQPVFQDCPVCKASVKDKIIPLYGRGKGGFASACIKTHHSFDVPRRPSAPQRSVPAANALQSTGFISHRGGHSTHLVTASGLFPALFGIHMLTSPDYSGRSSFGTALNALSRLPAVGATTRQQQQLNAQQESVLYWFLFLLGCLASVCFLLF